MTSKTSAEHTKINVQGLGFYGGRIYSISHPATDSCRLDLTYAIPNRQATRRVKRVEARPLFARGFIGRMASGLRVTRCFYQELVVLRLNLDSFGPRYKGRVRSGIIRYHTPNIGRPTRLRCHQRTACGKLDESAGMATRAIECSTGESLSRVTLKTVLQGVLASLANTTISPAQDGPLP